MTTEPRVLSGRYELREQIGQGGAGRVYRAHDRRLDRLVAVKELTDLGDTAVARFRREAATAARVRHPNVVTLHDAGVDDVPYLVMALVDGPSLDDRVATGGQLAPEDVVALAGDLLGGLSATHAVGVMHRDLTPRNVLFDRDGHALVADFGVARGPQDPTVTATHTIMGTRQFVAPERLHGTSATPRSDLFSLGVTLRFAATGAADAPMPAGHPAGRLVAACTEADPDRRPTTATAAMALLDGRVTTRGPTAPIAAPTEALAVEHAEPIPETTSVATGAAAQSHDLRGRRVRPLVIAAVLVAAVLAAWVGSTAFATDPAPADQPANEIAPTFDPDDPAGSARDLATWLRSR